LSNETCGLGVARRGSSRIALPLFSASNGDIVQNVLDDAAEGRLLKQERKSTDPSKPAPTPGRYSRESIVHMRAAVLRMFQAAHSQELIEQNRVKRTRVPDIEQQLKPRAQLTDAEVAQLAAHPDVDPEIKLLVLISRTVGGLRTGDLNRLDYSAFGPDFATCTFTRRKTRKKKPAPETHEVPAAIRPFIEAWWTAHKKPESGPVFPVRRGERAGEVKKQSKQSYAVRLRRELLVAGITRRELHVETPTTRPTHFHAMRGLRHRHRAGGHERADGHAPDRALRQQGAPPLPRPDRRPGTSQRRDPGARSGFCRDHDGQAEGRDPRAGSLRGGKRKRPVCATGRRC
jgi:integrase